MYHIINGTLHSKIEEQALWSLLFIHISYIYYTKSSSKK